MIPTIGEERSSLPAGDNNGRRDQRWGGSGRQSGLPSPAWRKLGMVAASLALSALTVGAAASAETEADRLRSMLRDATLQLRAAQSDLANLQAAQASLTQDRNALAAKYELLVKEVVAERASNEKTMTLLRTELAEQKALAARFGEELARTKKDGERAVQAHLAAEARYVRLTNEVYALQRRLADRETKNLALFLLGNEILTRYEDFSLGKALAAKEPFVGRTRTKLENLVQDYQDRLLDQRAR